MKQYQIRWSIEVFFKDCKQNLHLNSCQSTDFDANIAHISIVFMNYMILSLRKRIDDYETLGGIFREIKEQMLERILLQQIKHSRGLRGIFFKISLLHTTSLS